MGMIFRLDIKALEYDYDQIAGVLGSAVSFGWEEQNLPDGWILFRVHSESADFLEDIRCEIEKICKKATSELTETENRDWQAAWKEFFTPVLCGRRFAVVPPWLAGDDYGARQKIIIEPKSAFGTGHHATTALCLASLDSLLETGSVGAGGRFLDLGCGSGILGIAAAKNGLTGLGLDTDGPAVANARENISLNQTPGVEVCEGSVELARGKFDLIMANILARPLISLAPDICGLLAPGGCLVLSGILDSQADEVEAAYGELGKAAPAKDGEWRALVWDRSRIDR